jgi:phosphatidylglycerophosphatase C
LSGPTPSSSQKIVAFDLDGTLTTKDTLSQFLIWRAGFAKAFLKALLLLPYGVGYVLGLVSRAGIKQAALRRFISGVPAETMEMESQRFAKQVLPGLLRPQGLAALRAHVAAGDRVFLVTASPEFVSWAWALSEGLELVATRLEMANGRMTGRLDGLNCRRLEKVRRLSEILGEPVVLDVAYGDSDGDTDMLAAAREAHFKPFRN